MLFGVHLHTALWVRCQKVCDISLSSLPSSLICIGPHDENTHKHTQTHKGSTHKHTQPYTHTNTHRGSTHKHTQPYTHTNTHRGSTHTCNRPLPLCFSLFQTNYKPTETKLTPLFVRDRRHLKLVERSTEESRSLHCTLCHEDLMQSSTLQYFNPTTTNIKVRFKLHTLLQK